MQVYPMTFELRERFLPGPQSSSGYRTVLLVGHTGAGKTTLIRQLIGTDPSCEPFPATAAFKTTTAVTEVLCAPGPYYAMVTFSDRREVRADIEDCVVAAAVARRANRPPEMVRDALLAHLDQRLRLEYVLGPDTSAADRHDPDTSVADRRGLGRTPAPSWIDSTTETIAERVEALGDLSGDESEWGHQLRADPGIEDLVNQLLDTVLLRFAAITSGNLTRREDGWPLMWRITSDARGDVLRSLSRLAGNDRATFGSQLSPIVDGLRVRGPFHPTWAPEIPYLMAVDTVGLGHTPESASSLPAEIVRQLPRSDRVVLVDDASHPMQSATAAALRQLTNSGYLDRLVLCFTHVDGVVGPHVRTERDRRALLRRSVDQVTEVLRSDLDPATHAHLRTRLDSHTVFLHDLDQVVALDHPARGELVHLLDLIREHSLTIELDDAHPVFRLGDLRAAVATAIGEFDTMWRSRLGIDPVGEHPQLHWRQVLALCQRHAVGHLEYADLRPVGELHTLITEAVRRFASSPVRWDGYTPADHQRVELLDRISRSVGAEVLELVRRALVDDAHAEWKVATTFAGLRSSERRASFIAEEILATRLSLAREDHNLAASIVDLIAAKASALGALVRDTVAPPAATPPSALMPEPRWSTAS